MSEAQEKLSASIDRMHEAHFWLHSMESHYHEADQFRWCFNAFLRSLKEISQLITMEVQGNKEVANWFKGHKDNLNNDPLLKVLSKNRDFVVHQSMLLPLSSGTIGLSEGNKIKFGLGYPIHPLEDSAKAIHDILIKTEDVFGILQEDDDTIPCVHRSWKIKEFDEELANLCAKAWLRVSETIRLVLQELGEMLPPQDLSCRHISGNYQVKLYSRKELRSVLVEHGIKLK